MNAMVFISIGSNIGDREKNINKSLELLTKDPFLCRIILIKRSSFYETSPWGNVNQPPFVNCVIEVSTTFSPHNLLEFLKTIEDNMGRTPDPPDPSRPMLRMGVPMGSTVGARRWTERIIDLDIIFFDDKIIDEIGLKIPHPNMHERGFVLVPMAEIAPEVKHPVLKKTVLELLKGLKDKGEVRKIS